MLAATAAIVGVNPQGISFAEQPVAPIALSAAVPLWPPVSLASSCKLWGRSKSPPQTRKAFQILLVLCQLPEGSVPTESGQPHQAQLASWYHATTVPMVPDGMHCAGTSVGLGVLMSVLGPTFPSNA